MKHISYLLLCTLVFLTVSCGDENYHYPNVITELADLHTGPDGELCRLVNDRQEEWEVISASDKKHPADTVFRVLSMYEPWEETEGKKQAYLYSAKSVFAQPAIPVGEFQAPIARHPVEIERMWLAGNYLNMVLLVQVKDQPHEYRFVEESITTGENGSHTLCFSLGHNRKDDYEAYTEKVFMSLPLSPYKEVLQDGDCIVFSLNTYKEGMVSRTFTWPFTD